MIVKYVIEVMVYILVFFISSYAVKAIPFQRFLDHQKPKEAWILYILTVFALTYLVGSLVLKLMGIEIWIPNRQTV